MLIDAVSLTASASSAALTVTVCAVSQFDGAKVSAALTVTSASPLARVGVTVTLPVGSLSSTTV